MRFLFSSDLINKLISELLVFYFLYDFEKSQQLRPINIKDLFFLGTNDHPREVALPILSI